MTSYLKGVVPDHLHDFLKTHLEITKAINELIPTFLEDSSSSSDEEVFIPRTMLHKRYTRHQCILNVLADESYNYFRLPFEAFVQLLDILIGRGLLKDTDNIVAAEQLGIFLRGVAHAHSYRQLSEFFQRSLGTISRYFNIALRAILSLTEEFINLPLNVEDCHPYIRRNSQFYPFFSNAIGVIDNTHIPAIVGQDMQKRCINRKGLTSQNIMAAVSFDRQFVYVVAGWEGCATDMEVLQWSMVGKTKFQVPRGKYYLVDSAYAITEKFMTPFSGYRYHLSESHHDISHRYSTAQELYNHRHAQLQDSVKKTFAIWKERFQVLTHMQQFPFSVQVDIVLACAVLHNFIGRYHGYDHYFNMCQTEMEHDSELGEVIADDEDPDMEVTAEQRVDGYAIRHMIASDMWDAYEKAQRRQSI